MKAYSIIKLVLLIGFTFFGEKAGYAQQNFRGKIYEARQRIVIGGVTITNLRTKVTTVSDSSGSFNIPAAINDLITFKSFVFRADTVLVIDFREHAVYLTPLQASLAEVVINGQIRKMKLGSLIDPEYHGQTVVYQKNDDGSVRGGLTFRLHYWNKDGKARRRSIKRMENHEIYLGIDKMFDPLNLQKYIPLKGVELSEFIAIYRPSIEIFNNKDFNLLLYINDSYKRFMALPPDRRKLPPLKTVD